jgi:hypothetical protein
LGDLLKLVLVLVERLVPRREFSICPPRPVSCLSPVSCLLSPRPLRSLFIPAAAVALIAQLAVLRSVIAGRAPASTPGRSARLAEIAWVVLPTLVLIAILLLTWDRLGEPVVVAPMAGVQA